MNWVITKEGKESFEVFTHNIQQFDLNQLIQLVIGRMISVLVSPKQIWEPALPNIILFQHCESGCKFMALVHDTLAIFLTVFAKIQRTKCNQDAKGFTFVQYLMER